MPEQVQVAAPTREQLLIKADAFEASIGRQRGAFYIALWHESQLPVGDFCKLFVERFHHATFRRWRAEVGETDLTRSSQQVRETRTSDPIAEQIEAATPGVIVARQRAARDVQSASDTLDAVQLALNLDRALRALSLPSEAWEEFEAHLVEMLAFVRQQKEE